jgi:hypothetical protein
LIATPEIQVAPRIAPLVDSCQEDHVRKCFVNMADAPSSDGPKFTVLNQSVTEIGAQRRSCDINPSLALVQKLEQVTAFR